MKQRKNKAFTLIELLAVIVIIGIVSLITVPAVVKIIDKSTQDTYEKQAALIIEAAKTYRLLYNDEITWYGNKGEIYLKDLQDKGLLPDPLEDSRGGDFDNNKPGGYKVIVIEYGGQEPVYDLFSSGELLGDLTLANAPQLPKNVIPVTYDGTNWVKADLYNRQGSFEWYNYDAFKWANAVTIVQEQRDKYIQAEVGTIIPISHINTMWVWIPRYKYKIPVAIPATTPREIDVIFERRTTPKSMGDAVSTYYTHPAFTFGEEELNGLWIGKFETSGTVNNLTIIPNSPSLLNLTASDMFYAIKDHMQSQTTQYGFINDNDVHMMKNTEWGAMAYLGYSHYGKFGDLPYPGNSREIYKNNSSDCYTGRSMGAPDGSGIMISGQEYTASGYYTYDGKCAMVNDALPDPCKTGAIPLETSLIDKKLAYGASTSGTIYGIYDTSGGADELMMANYDKTIASSWFDISFFNNLTNEKYYNLYTTLDSTTACKGICYGQALSETAGWYQDNSVFVTGANPWLRRGTNYHSINNGGLMSFGNQSGEVWPNLSFRIVLTLKN